MYFFLLSIVSAYYKFFFGAEFYGTKNIPQKGGVLILANHLSNNDPPIITTHIPRKLTFMAKKELFKIPLLGSFVKSCGAFPIDRSVSDISAVRTALKLLKEGNALMMFPEGRRNKEFVSSKIKPGALTIASKAGVPILPVYIEGKYRLFGKTKIYYGKPIPPEKIQELIKSASENTADKTTIMSDFIYNSILSSREDF
ncbi:MAG: 1-acyl-sn-glycerol-3-phosphate acyltransferase [Clostridia bacterium]|nr:1-acyl-sn-glycerol-3-phosphate acyltransferase [Clostridia bacterium]